MDQPDDRADKPVERLAQGPDGEPMVLHEIGRRTYIVARVDPLDVDGVRTVAVGTILWLVAFVLLLPFYGRLQDTDRVWWLWTCLAGFGLGLLGWDYCRRRRNRRRVRQATGTTPPA
ncbi:MAG: DUF2530 domain-containing protein [Nocardioidaceae bacterium]